MSNVYVNKIVLKESKFNKYVIGFNGRKILKSNSIPLGTKFYDLSKKRPPQVIINPNGIPEIYDSNVHYEYADDCYVNINLMIKYYDKNNKLSKFVDTDNMRTVLGEEKFNSSPWGVQNDGNCIYFENLEVAAKHKYVETYDISCPLSPKGMEKTDKQKAVYKEYKHSYSSEKSLSKKLALDYGVASSSFVGTGGMHYTFGVEIETSRGRLPNFIYHSENLNLDCVRDGSLKDSDGSLYGGEYVTGVLKGDFGLKNLQRSLKAISERCMIDSRCGIHVHIGGFEATSKFTVLGYILSCKVQDEVLKLFPPSRRGNEYASFLPGWEYENYIKKHGLSYGVDLAYEDLFLKMLNAKIKNRKLGDYNKFRKHPGGRYTDRYSAGIPVKDLYRYKWINFITCNFNTRQAPVKSDKLLNKGVPFTLEFRCHSASMNYTKIRNWVLFCMCYVNFIENHGDKILSMKTITVNDIINTVLNKKPKSRNRLISYFEERKAKFGPKHGVSNEKLEYAEVPEFKKNTLKNVILG